MNAAVPARRPECVGYLAILEDPRLGFTGGLLIVSPNGRPLEFHCSTPIAPTRAQQILFGPTLRPHLCGELIAPALLKAAKLKPLVLLVQQQEAAPVTESVRALVVRRAIVAGQEPVACPPAALGTAGKPVVVGGFELQLLRPEEPCPSATRGMLEKLTSHISLDEPFERVIEAVREAQRLSGPEAADDVAA